MWTLVAVLNSALKSMTASQAALGVASNNIANASNPDFTRQRLNLAPAVPDLASFGIGTGVEIVGVEALRDSLIEMRLSHELSAKAGADTLSSRIGYIEAQ